jgi:hypothetical protein
LYRSLSKPLALHDILFVPIGPKDDKLVHGHDGYLLNIVDYKHIVTK